MNRHEVGLAVEGPAREREWLRAMPNGVRIAFAFGVVATGVYAAVYLAVRALEPARAEAMLKMYVFTIAAGRETAMFDALHHHLPATWAFALSVLDDLGSLLLALCFAWLFVNLLKRSPRVRWSLSRLEKEAIVHRAFVHRWGLAGLALLYYLPGFGAGVPLTALLVVLARLPFRRTIFFFAVATILVDGMWAIVLSQAEHSVPHPGWLDQFPYIVIAIVAALTAWSMWRNRRERHVAILDFPVEATLAQSARQRAAGITLQDGVIRADLDLLQATLAVRYPRGELLAAAELLLLYDMDPAMAINLVDAGIGGIDVMARDPRRLTELARDPAFEGLAGHRGEWVNQAGALVQAQHAGWRQ